MLDFLYGWCLSCYTLSATWLISYVAIFTPPSFRRLFSLFLHADADFFAYVSPFHDAIFACCLFFSMPMLILFHYYVFYWYFVIWFAAFRCFYFSCCHIFLLLSSSSLSPSFLFSPFLRCCAIHAYVYFGIDAAIRFFDLFSLTVIIIFDIAYD